MIHGPGGIDAVEALEDIFQILLGNRFAGICHGKQGMVGTALPEDHMNRAVGIGVLLGVVQKNFQHLGKVLGRAPDVNIFCDIVGQQQALFIEHGLKGQKLILHQTAQVYRCQGKLLNAAVVHPGQLQETFHQTPHLLGHGEDVVGEAPDAGICGGALLLQQLNIREDNG